MSGVRAMNLRTRLTVLYGALLAAGLLAYAVCISVAFFHDLREQLDSSLHRDLETVEGALSMDSRGKLVLNSHEGEAEDPDDIDRGYLLEVWSFDGELLYRSEQLRGQALGPAPRTTPSYGREPATSLRLPSGMLVRTMSRAHHLPGGKLVAVRLAVSERPLWGEFWEMVTVLGIGLPIVVVLVVITGYIVAARALKPVDAMAERAAEITAEHLNERLVIQNPNDELGKLGAAFNATLARLESSFHQLRRFTADASHELRTPLTAIRSVGEVSLQKQGDSKYYRDIIGSMLEETNRLTKLVDSLLTMSRADAGRVQLHVEKTGLLDLARESASLLEVLAEEKGQTLLVEGDDTLSVMADRTILRQALVNLIDNAVKYSPVGGEIRVSVRAVNGAATIKVQDSGPGIPPEHAEKVFERFYRIDKARSRADGGAGLGLSIVQWSVFAHGGKVELDLNAAPGCAFVIHLPLKHKEHPLLKES